MSDRSDWTTVAGKPNKQKSEDKSSSSTRKIVDPLMGDINGKNSERRSEPSLMQLHQKSLKKNTDTDPSQEKERTRFDRERDIGISREVDSKRKRDMIEKASSLDSKFSRSS